VSGSCSQSANDTAPLGGGTLSVQGDAARSDPFNLERDKGPNSLDIRHTFNASVVALSKFSISNRVLSAILNDNQVSLLVQVNSGTPVQVAGNTDLNGDGTNNDRPIDITRNSLNLPLRKNVDARISRFVNFAGHYKFEVQAEFKNIFNWEQVSGVQTTYAVNATTGVPTVVLPINSGALIPTGGYEQRKFQLGFKLFF
jgi:hypothetical protein